MDAWDTLTKDLCTIINAILINVHPDQYRAGAEAFKCLNAAAERYPFCKHWHSAFNGVAIMSNRQTPSHRDQQGWRTCYDLLLTVGAYEDGDFHVPDLGIRLRYASGTVVCILGSRLRHAVRVWGADAERVCWAYFMRQELLWHCGVRAPDWPSVRSSIQTDVNLK